MELVLKIEKLNSRKNAIEIGYFANRKFQKIKDQSKNLEKVFEQRIKNTKQTEQDTFCLYYQVVKYK